MDGDTFIITICVNGLTIKLSVPRDKEELYRKAAKLLNERIDVYIKKFRVPYTDILTMVAYEMAFNVIKQDADYNESPLSLLSDIATKVEELKNEDAE